MNISPNAVYQSDCLVLLERIEEGQAMLIYIDAPSYPLIELPSGFSDLEDPEEVLKKAEADYQEGLNEYLFFLSKVLQQVQRILSPNGNVFIQSAHHLTGHTRLLLDQIFGMRNFRGEFIWPNRQRQTQSAQRKAGHDHDTLIRYSKTSSYVDKPQYRTLPVQGSGKLSEYTDSHGNYRLTDITSPYSEPSLQFEWNGSVPPPGRSWRFSKERLDELHRAGMIVQRPKNKLLALKVYMDDGPKVEV